MSRTVTDAHARRLRSGDVGTELSRSTGGSCGCFAIGVAIRLINALYDPTVPVDLGEGKLVRVLPPFAAGSLKDGF